MKLSISYQEAQQRYPTLVAEALNIVQGSKNKKKGMAPDQMRWFLTWCVRIDGSINGNDFVKMLTGETPFPAKPKKLNEDETVADYTSRAVVSLQVVVGRTPYYGRTHITPLPKEIEDMVRKNYQEEEAENKRFNGLTPQEKQNELDANLRELSKSPGFFGISIPQRGRHNFRLV